MSNLLNLSEGYTFGKGFFIQMKQTMPKGRTAGVAHDAGILAQLVLLGGNGDFVEIGTLFGGSAILAATAKKKFGLGGFVYCVDPLDGYYGTGKSTAGGIPSPEIVMGNAKFFGVDDKIKIIKKSSIPWPKELMDHKFSVAFIDGDHWGEAPWKDWLSVKNLTSKFIIFDNYDNQHPAVINGAKKATADPEWQVICVSGISYVLEKNPKLTDPHKAAGGKYG